MGGDSADGPGGRSRGCIRSEDGYADLASTVTEESAMAPKIVVTDVTDATWRELRTWPYGPNVPAHPSALCLTNVEQCKVFADREVENKNGFNLPMSLRARDVGTSWQPPDFDGTVIYLKDQPAR